MKTIRIKYLFVFTVLSLCFSCKTTKEKLLVSGCGWRQVAILDKASGAIEWSHPLAANEDCNDVELTPKGHILYAYTRGARLIDRKQQVIWDFKARKGEELFTATTLPNGTYLLAICGNPSRIIELDKDGKMLNELAFDSQITGVHDQFRQILKTPDDTYLIPLMGKGEVVEMNKDKAIINRAQSGGNPFAIQLMKNGNWLVSCGDAHKFVEIDPQTGQIVHSVESKELRDASLLFVAELVRYPNGNTLICNWNGHSKDKSQPLLLEIDKQNRIVWKLAPNPDIVNISSVYSFKER